MKISQRVHPLLKYLTDVRQYLHTIPEIGFDLFETQKFVMNELAKCNPDSIRKIAKTGIKVVFLAEGATKTIGFRADMDAMRNTEAFNVPYRSKTEGVMHGCGHDGHTAILLGLAKLISENRDKLKHNVVLLFQPGEEGCAGAKRMIEEGALQSPDIDKLYGLHLWPSVPKGKVGVRWEHLMAQSSDFYITVKGKSTHASTPQLGIDAIVAAAELINMLQGVITRNVDPHQDALLTLGKIEGGTSFNVIADYVKIEGTLRVFNPELFESLTTRIKRVMEGLNLATGAEFEFHEKVSYPCVYNPREMVEEFYGILDSEEDRLLIEPVMAAEDFAEYQLKIPALFFFLGINGGKGGAPLHNNLFDFDEDALLYGLEIFKRILEI